MGTLETTHASWSRIRIQNTLDAKGMWCRSATDKEKSLILPRCTYGLGLVVQQNLTSAGVVCQLTWRAQLLETRTPVEGFPCLTVPDELALMLVVSAASVPSRIRAARRRRICHGRVSVRERERERERAK